MKSAAFLAALAAILPAYVAGQAGLYAQCGGIGFCKSRFGFILRLPKLINHFHSWPDHLC